MRVKAESHFGLAADSITHRTSSPRVDGDVRTDVASGDVDVLFAEGEIDLEEARNLPCHTGVRLLRHLARAWSGQRRQEGARVRGDREVFWALGRSAEQRWPWICCSTNPSSASFAGGKAGYG